MNMTEGQSNPFIAVYQAGDGKVVVRFESDDGERVKVFSQVVR